MDLEALCCTEGKKISETYSSQKRQTRTGNGITGCGAERSPFQLFEKTLGFLGNMNESSSWTLLSPAETRALRAGVGWGGVMIDK